jgi:hypothetical protein
MYGDIIYLTSKDSGITHKLKVDSVMRLGYNICRIDCTEISSKFSNQPIEALDKQTKYPDKYSFKITFDTGLEPKIEIIHQFAKSSWDKSSDEYSCIIKKEQTIELIKTLCRKHIRI